MSSSRPISLRNYCSSCLQDFYDGSMNDGARTRYRVVNSFAERVPSHIMRRSHCQGADGRAEKIMERSEQVMSVPTSDYPAVYIGSAIECPASPRRLPSGGSDGSKSNPGQSQPAQRSDNEAVPRYRGATFSCPAIPVTSRICALRGLGNDQDSRRPLRQSTCS
ncbi:hypothetical protein OH77DRAFT_472738 [Trametes cingulata]|nr:hypothetical protein OH77DRAFT_472738 [Trametes cingulata]